MEKRLYRSNENRMIAGVCGGLAEYTGIEATVIRLVWALGTFVFGIGLILYIAAAVIMPNKDEVFSGVSYEKKEEKAKFDSKKNQLILGLAFVFFGVLFLGRRVFYWMDFEMLMGIVIIGAGTYFILKSRRG